MRRLYNGLQIQTYNLHDLIYEQGEIGDNLYVCLRGQVGSYIEKKIQSIKSEDDSENETQYKEPKIQNDFEEEDIEFIINNQQILEIFKQKREEKLDRKVRQFMHDKAKHTDKKRKKEQEQHEYDIQKLMNRQKLIQQIIESNKTANSTLYHSITQKQSKVNILKQRPSLQQKHILTETDSQKSISQLSQNKSLNHQNQSQIVVGGENNLLMKRYQWKQSLKVDSSHKRSPDIRSESQQMLSQSNLSQDSKNPSLKDSIIHRRLSRVKMQNRGKDSTEISNLTSQQIQQQVGLGSDKGDLQNKQNHSRKCSIDQFVNAGNSQMLPDQEESLLFKDSEFVTEPPFDEIKAFLGNLDKICDYKAGQMFGIEPFMRNIQRQSFIMVMSSELKVAVLNKNIFEDILMTIYENQLYSDIDFLKKNPLFNKFDDQELEQILLKIESVNYKKDSIVYKEEDPSDKLYLVKEGEIEIDQIVDTEKKQDDSLLINQQVHSKRQKIAIIGPCQLFGESEILKDIKRITRAKTLSIRNVFYVFDSNQIKFLLEYSDLKETLNLARQNKSSWRSQRLKNIQIATKIHQQSVKKILDNKSILNSNESQSPQQNKSQSSHQDKSQSPQSDKNQMLSKKSNQQNFHQPVNFKNDNLNLLRIVPNNPVSKRFLSRRPERTKQTLSPLNDLKNREVVQFQSQLQNKQFRNQSFSHQKNQFKQFYQLKPNQIEQNNSLNQPQSLSPLKKITQKYERKISLDFYNNFSVKFDQEQTLKNESTEKSLSVNSDRKNSCGSQSFLQPLKSKVYNVCSKFNIDKQDSYNPDINQTYITQNQQQSQSSLENNKTNIQESYTKLPSTNQINNSYIQQQSNMYPHRKQRKVNYSPNIHQDSCILEPISSFENNKSKEKCEQNQGQNFNPLDTLTPFMEKSKKLDSLSKTIKQLENIKSNNSSKKGENRPTQRIFIFENQPLQQLYMNCKYNHKQYNYSASRKSKRSQIMTPTSKAERREDDQIELDQHIRENHHLNNELKKQIQLSYSPNQSPYQEQKQQYDSKTLKELVQKNTITKVSYLKEDANVKLNTNILQRITEESTSKYRLNAMKQILESSHQIQNLNYLYKCQKVKKYNDLILPSYISSQNKLDKK